MRAAPTLPPVSLIPVSLTLAANLPAVSLTLVANSTTLVKLVAKFAAVVVDTVDTVDTGGNFATGVVDTGGQP
jgi:hypothetical protein